MNNGLQAVNLDDLPQNYQDMLPANWRLWQYEGQVIFDKPIRPTFPTTIETLERRLTISNGVLGEEQLLVLPHFNAHVADFIEGDQVVLFCHTQADVPDPENHYTPGFFTLDGDWSFVLNLDTQSVWGAGRGVGRNRRYAWKYEPDKERFLEPPTDPFYLIAEKPTLATVLQNITRYLPHTNRGARDVFAEGYKDIHPLYKAVMRAMIEQDAAEGHSKERNFRGKPGHTLQMGDSLLR